MRILLIGLGGAVGSMLRYLVGGWVQQLAPDSAFPYGTLAVNVSGCLMIGLLVELAEVWGAIGADTRALLVVGFLGGFTTFSAFANETVNALRDGVAGLAIVNVLASVLLGLAAVWSGRQLAHVIWR